ncbi:MAG: GNAT family N-acetyltransferase, partial [Bacteroidia bacterium]|nr:GNAT family N-acetyltransferase [Bacteroidia bacterium]
VRFSSSQRKVSIEEHNKWIDSILGSHEKLVYIIEINNKSIGQIRFEKTSSSGDEVIVSIYFIVGFTGKGFGSLAMEQGIYKIFEKWKEINCIKAHVRKDNIQGIKFFQKQGFKLYGTDVEDTHYIYVLQINEYNAKKNRDYYSKLVKIYGNDIRSLNWGSRASQELRFKIFTEIGDLQGKKILDVGCGLCDFYEYLTRNKIYVDYKGIDITPEMIELSQKRFPELKLEIKDILVEKEVETYDYVFASGIFYLIEVAPSDFMKKMIKTMFELTNFGLAFNSLSAWASQKEEKEFYAEPTEVINFCRSLTNKIIFKHHYHPADFTIFLYK